MSRSVYNDTDVRILFLCAEARWTLLIATESMDWEAMRQAVVQKYQQGQKEKDINWRRIVLRHTKASG